MIIVLIRSKGTLFKEKKKLNAFLTRPFYATPLRVLFHSTDTFAQKYRYF